LTVESIQHGRKNTGVEQGILGGRPCKYEWGHFEQEMETSQEVWNSPHMKQWVLDNWNQSWTTSFRKTVWGRYACRDKKANIAAKAKEWRSGVRGRLSKKGIGFRKKDKEVKQTWNINDLEEFLKGQKLDMENETIVDFYDGEIIDLSKDSYQFDHIEGHSGALENLAVTKEQYNQMKNMWTLDETLDACEKLLRYWRPEVLK